MTLKANGESIDKAFWDTADASEKMEILSHQFQNAIEPLAGTLFDAVADIMPALFDLFNELAPFISELAETLVPIIKEIFGLITSLMPVIKFLAGIISTTLGAVIKTIVPILENVIGVLTNVIDFLVNVFTGQWGAAWKNIVDLVVNLFKGLAKILMAPFKVVANAVEAVKGKIGKNKVTDENTGDLPKLAKGGFTNGVSIAGEAGREAVISFNPAYRSDNISTWLKAGELLGLGSSGTPNSYNLGGITFSPNLYFTQKMSDEDVVEAVKRCGHDFMDFVQDKMAEISEVSYRPTTNAY